MTLALYPKPLNLAVGIATGVAVIALGRYLMALAADPDNEAIWAIIGLLAMAGGLWVVASCTFRLIKPRPSFEADAEGFSVMGKRKQPWDRFQGVGVWAMKQHGITTVQSVYVKVGKGPTFARKRHIKWTHLSASAPDMANEILTFAKKQMFEAQMGALLNHVRGDGPAARSAETAPKAQPEPATVQSAFADGPIQSTGRRGLFGR